MMQDHAAERWRPYPAYEDAERLRRVDAFRSEMETRRSCRAFSDKPVPRAIIESAIRTAASAPSGANHQPWHFAIVGGAEAKAAIRIAAEEEERRFYAGAAGEDWLRALQPLGTDASKPYLEMAPWLIVLFAQRRGGVSPGEALQNYYVTESVGIAAGMLLSALHVAGLATLTHTPNPMRFLNRICRRPSDEKPLMIVVTGHPADDATIPQHALRKKPLEQVTSWV